jgi:hypothetical protein
MKAWHFWVLAIIVLFVVAMCTPDLAEPRSRDYPPNYAVYVRIAQCEQPAPVRYQKENGRWPANMRWGVWWKQTHNYSFKGGGGMQTYLWTEFRRPSARRYPTMDLAPIHEQLWSMHRLYLWAEKTYPGAGYTAWDCAKKSWFR